jgi:CheY-like chemotaxis protein
VYLPRITEDAQQYVKPGGESEPLNGSETLLLIEDDDMLRRLSVEVLESYGYRVLSAPNGGSALLLCERHPGPIHLLVSDVVMPEMSGREAADRLLKLRPELKVLFVSGYTDNSIVHHGVLAEGANFLQKPFSPEALARKVREVLNPAVKG